MTADAYIIGKSETKHFFYAISAKEQCSFVDIFLFAKLYHDTRTGIRFWGIVNKGDATYKLCLEATPDVDKDFVVNDILEDENYKIQVHIVDKRGS